MSLLPFAQGRLLRAKTGKTTLQEVWTYVFGLLGKGRGGWDLYVGLSRKTKEKGKKFGISSQKEDIAKTGHPTAEPLRKAWKDRIRQGDFRHP